MRKIKNKSKSNFIYFFIVIQSITYTLYTRRHHFYEISCVISELTDFNRIKLFLYEGDVFLKTVFTGYITVFTGYIAVFTGYITVFTGYITVFTGYITVFTGYITVFTGYIAVFTGYITVFTGYIAVAGVSTSHTCTLPAFFRHFA